MSSELVKRGLPVFAFNQRSVADILQMIRVQPSRRGWTIYEIPSTYILQPGPASLTDGVRMIHERLASMYAD
jgi:hypothetical protein